jgi:hypothetical protein
MVRTAPASVRLRAYQVGFGDCLLLTINYSAPLPDGRSERHLLIDYGNKVKSEEGPSLGRLAPLIAEHCGGHLDVVVATHRHQDHVRGFGDLSARDHLIPLEPSLIIRPWTDGPADAPGVDGTPLDPDSRGFLATLDSLGKHASKVADEFGFDANTMAGRVGQLAELGVGNVQALAMLDSWTQPDPTVWVRADDRLDTKKLLPGVGIRVLGPPTLADVPDMRSYASSSSDYWLRMARDNLIAPELGRPMDGELWASRDTVAQPGGFGAASWLVEKMHDAAARQTFDIVAGFDGALNNTSVVLLLTIGDRSLLLAGDAQVENWSWTLDRALGENKRRAKPQLRRALEAVEVYKVGHHGSRNATPRRLVDLWATRPKGTPFCSVLSTMKGVFDKSEEGAVPKKELVDALKRLGPVHSTQHLPAGTCWFDLEAPAQGRGITWTYAPGPVVGRPKRRA